MVVEWIATIVGLYILWLPYDIVTPTDTVLWKRAIQFSYRYIFSSCLSLMILSSLSPTKETTISWARPSKYFRGLLSMKIWLPIATVSYSIYLWHHTLMSILGAVSFTDLKKQIDNVGGNCEEVVKIGAWPLV